MGSKYTSNFIDYHKYNFKYLHVILLNYENMIIYRKEKKREGNKKEVRSAGVR